MCTSQCCQCWGALGWGGVRRALIYLLYGLVDFFLRRCCGQNGGGFTRPPPGHPARGVKQEVMLDIGKRPNRSEKSCF